jgi:hypothetical protein
MPVEADIWAVTCTQQANTVETLSTPVQQHSIASGMVLAPCMRPQPASKSHASFQQGTAVLYQDSKVQGAYMDCCCQESIGCGHWPDETSHLALPLLLISQACPTCDCRPPLRGCALTAARKDLSHVRVTGGPRIATPTARRVRSWLVQDGSEVRARRMALQVTSQASCTEHHT